MKIIQNMIRAMILILPIALSGCSVSSTGETEVGLVASSFILGGGPIKDVIISPGRTTVMMPWKHVYKVNVGRRMMEFKYMEVRGQEAAIQDPDSKSLDLRTADGNPVHFSIQVVYHVDNNPATLWRLIDEIATSNEAMDNIVEGCARTKTRDALGFLMTDQIFHAELRQAKFIQAVAMCNKVLEGTGIVVDEIIYNAHNFDTEYQNKINEAKALEQKAEGEERKVSTVKSTQAALLAQITGEANRKIANAYGEANKHKVIGDQYFSQKELDASATQTEYENKVTAINAQVSALQGSGAEILVMQDIADALTCDFYIIPNNGSPSGLNMQTLDLNQLIKQMPAISAAAAKKAISQTTQTLEGAR